MLVMTLDELQQQTLIQCEAHVDIINRQMLGTFICTAGRGSPKRVKMPVMELVNAPDLLGLKDTMRFIVRDKNTHKRVNEHPLMALEMLGFLLGMSIALDKNGLSKLTEEDEPNVTSKP